MWTWLSHSISDLSRTPMPLHLLKEWCLLFAMRWLPIVSTAIHIYISIHIHIILLQTLQKQGMTFMRCSAYMEVCLYHNFSSRNANRTWSIMPYQRWVSQCWWLVFSTKVYMRNGKLQAQDLDRENEANHMYSIKTFKDFHHLIQFFFCLA